MFFSTLGAGLTVSGYIGLDTFEASEPSEAFATVVVAEKEVFLTNPDLFSGALAFAGITLAGIGAVMLGRGLRGTK